MLSANTWTYLFPLLPLSRNMCMYMYIYIYVSTYVFF
jgi:hypothetical protein